uniref:Uncharacterized protein n=1 Tax=Arundo donax TaxID=35708 RepID=A0A0A9BRW3_ARUDO
MLGNSSFVYIHNCTSSGVTVLYD